ncbi:MAG: hypothetical protein ACTSR8_08950 [Promethearchaeota archaeon]
MNENKSDYNTIILREYGLSNVYKNETEIPIIAPKLCPFCGEERVKGELKIYSTKTRTNHEVKSTNPNYWINILVCKNHLKFNKYQKYSFFLSLFCGIPILAITSVIILVLTVGVFWTIAIVFPLLFGYVSYAIIKAFWSVSFINKNIIFEYFGEKSVISTKNLEWAKRFQKLNDGTEFEGDLNEFKEIESSFYKKLKRFLGIFFINFFFIILTTIIAIILQNPVIIWIPISICITLVVVFMYYIYKEEELLTKTKSKYYFKNLEK